MALKKKDYDFITSCLTIINRILDGQGIKQFDELYELDRIAQRNGNHPTNFGCSGCKKELLITIKNLYDEYKK